MKKGIDETNSRRQGLLLLATLTVLVFRVNLQVEEQRFGVLRKMGCRQLSDFGGTRGEDDRGGIDGARWWRLRSGCSGLAVHKDSPGLAGFGG